MTSSMRFSSPELGLAVACFDPSAEWDHSEFPHPLICLDYTAHGEVYQVSAHGPKAEALKQYTAALVEGFLKEES